MNIQELLRKQQQQKNKQQENKEKKETKTVSLKDLSKYKEELTKKEEDTIQEEPKQETPKINLGNILTKKPVEKKEVQKEEKVQENKKKDTRKMPQKGQKQASKKTSKQKSTNTPVENNLPVEGFPELSTTKTYTGHIYMTVPEDDGFGKGFIVFSNNEKTYTLFVNKGLVGAELPVLNSYIQKGYNVVFCQFRVNSMEVDGKNTLYASHIVTMGESKYNEVLKNIAENAPKISFKGVSLLLSELEELGVVDENNKLTESDTKDIIDALELSGVRVNSGGTITGWFK